MATTSSGLMAGKALAGQGGHGKGYKGRAAGLVAGAALGLSLLTGVVFSQARPAAQPATAQAGGNPITAGTQFVPDHFTYREDHRTPRAADASVAADYRWDFGEGLQATRPAEASTATEYRWGYTSVAVPGFVPDQFTYREDRRAGMIGPAGTLSGGSYADLIFELEQAVSGASSASSATAATTLDGEQRERTQVASSPVSLAPGAASEPAPTFGPQP